MKHNDTITICSCKFRINLTSPSVPDWSPNSFIGRSSLAGGVISLDPQLNESMRNSTMLHEVIHVIANLTDLPKLDEVTISVISVGLFDFLRQNKKLANEMIYGDKMELKP